MHFHLIRQGAKCPSQKNDCHQCRNAITREKSFVRMHFELLSIQKSGTMMRSSQKQNLFDKLEHSPPHPRPFPTLQQLQGSDVQPLCAFGENSAFGAGLIGSCKYVRCTSTISGSHRPISFIAKKPVCHFIDIKIGRPCMHYGLITIQRRVCRLHATSTIRCACNSFFLDVQDTIDSIQGLQLENVRTPVV